MFDHPKILKRTVTAAQVDPDSAMAFVQAVGADIVSATAASNLAAIHHARTIATFCEEAAATYMPLALGLDEIDLAEEAMRAALAARRASIVARLALVGLPSQIGITGFGPWCPCQNPPEKKENGAVTVEPIAGADCQA